jgi:CHAT domain-containing protein
MLCRLAQSATANNVDELIERGQAHLRQGQYYLALDDLNEASRQDLTPERRAKTEAAQGLTYYRMHLYEEAFASLNRAIAREAGAAPERAGWIAALANLEADRGHPEEARSLYARALPLAGGERGLLAGIRLGQIALSPWDERLRALQALRPTLDAIAGREERAARLLNLGAQAQGLGEEGLQTAYEAYEQAARDGASSPRLLAEALGGMAQLYENRQRREEALRLGDRAIEAARGAEAHDLLLELEWRQGRLLNALHKRPEAIAAYQRAVDHIEAIRQDIPVEYHEGHSSFRETLAPIYLGLADLLLQEARRRQGEEKTRLLNRARETVELSKQSEMEDFLGGRCAVQSVKSAALEQVEPHTAVLYPIMLPDRLELLVSGGEEIRQFTQPVDAQTLELAGRKLARYLRTGDSEAQGLSRELYDWLIAPLEPWLRERGVTTLVVAPDGALRLIPLAALFDGEHYLIERYAIAVSPGLTLLQPAPLQQRGIDALLAGMSEPGPVVERLPSPFLRAVAGAVERGLARGGDAPRNRALPLDEGKPAGAATTMREAETLMRDPVFREQLQRALSLPGVAQEIENLSQRKPNTVLLNEQFTVNAFKREMLKTPYSVVHIASHGVFGKTADSSFVMAYDAVLNMDELERLLRSEKFKRSPVELLTLSACQTAEGDDRAPLGLSGIAIKARVRGALGTLWPVADEAASRLMAKFYEELAQPGVSKVEALRRAQLSLLKDERMAHPFFWSPFILVGNWL